MIYKHRRYYEDDWRDGIYRPPGGRPTVQRKKWLDITWTFAEFFPAGQLSGFEVAIINGTDPNDPSKYIRAPEILGADERRLTVSVSLGTNLNNARAAVRALYGGAKSAWTVQGVGQVLHADGEELPTLSELNDVQAQAVAAQNDAVIALQGLGDIAADGKLTGGEKKRAIREHKELIDERSDLNAQADRFGIGPAKSGYNNAIDALANYLGGLSPAWNHTGTTTAISRTLWNANWQAVFEARQTLLNTVRNETKWCRCHKSSQTARSLWRTVNRKVSHAD
ncbi:hypothetical protein ACL7TT_06710, partial [Microbulbifer sp. 2304DJ12-6]|uniref:hypothetical protein n=1 Tax=Microbulbifer sp. 2304DJ12-6 TaxID=3233340 RepID=UPI0039AF7B19